MRNPAPNKIQFRKYIPALLWSGFIFLICLLPGNTFPKEDFLDKIQFDKIVHAVLYFILCRLLMNGIRQDVPDTKKQFSVTAVICISQGILIEYLQGSAFIRNRSFDIWDIAANITGVLLGILLVSLKHKTN